MFHSPMVPIFFLSGVAIFVLIVVAAAWRSYSKEMEKLEDLEIKILAISHYIALQINEFEKRLYEIIKKP